MPKEAPTVSIVIPAYKSEATVAATLASLRAQDFLDFEVIVVDSSPGDETEQIVTAQFPEVNYVHSKCRLLPHGARNEGVKRSSGDLLLFTDPDIQAEPDWVGKMIAAHASYGGIVVGGVASVQSDWLSTGIHIAKFDLWLAGGLPRTESVGPTVNMICSRTLYDDVGGLDAGEMLGDSTFCWAAQRRGHPLHVMPTAIVHHDHRSTFRDLTRERRTRGADFGRIRATEENWPPAKTIWMIFASLVPLRLAKLVARSMFCCIRSGWSWEGVKTLPVVAAGHGAWLLGECDYYFARLARR